MDRTAQRKTLLDLINGPMFGLQDKADELAAKAGATSDALLAAQHELDQASAAFNAHTGKGAAVDTASDKVAALQAAEPVDKQAATDAYLAFTAVWLKGKPAWDGLLQNPGQLERP